MIWEAFWLRGPRQVSLEQKYLQKQGWTLLSSAVVLYQQWFQRTDIFLAFCCYLIL